MREALWDGVLRVVGSLKNSQPGHFSSRDVAHYNADETSVSCDMKMGQDDGTSTVYRITVSVETSEDSADDFWTERSTHPHIWQQPADCEPERRVVVDGQHYTIGPGNSGGYGGRRWDIEFFDGRRVTTHDLWSQGTIPPKHRERYPDNARFLPQETKPFVLDLEVSK